MEPQAKVAKLENDASTSQPHDDEKNLLYLSDDVLLQIASYLGPVELMNMSKTCQRLARIVSDHTLWSAADFRPHCLPLKDLKKSVKFLHPSTQTVAIRGFLVACAEQPKHKTECVTVSLLKDIKKASPHLSTLILEEVMLDAFKVRISDFPPTLRYLSLARSHLYNTPARESYFKRIHEHIPPLIELVLDGCGWMENHSLMAISKCPELKVLRLKGCHLIGRCLPYTALATRFGFRKLEVVDLRDTPTANSDISCYCMVNSLTHLYIGNKNRRMNEPRQEEANENDDEGVINDECIHNIGFHTTKLHTLVMQYTNVTDISLRHLAASVSSLRHLDVKDTKVSEKGVENFKVKRAECIIDSDYG